MYADCVVFFTLYNRRDSFLYVRVGSSLLYPLCTVFASDVYLIALDIINNDNYTNGMVNITPSFTSGPRPCSMKSFPSLISVPSL